MHVAPWIYSMAVFICLQAHNDTIFMKKKKKKRLNGGDGDPPGGVADEVDEDDGDEQDRVGLQLGQPLRAHTGENQDDADIYIYINDETDFLWC